MRILIAYNFDYEDNFVIAPNFYKDCAEQIFIKYSNTVTFLPTFKNRIFFKSLAFLGFRESVITNFFTFFWLLINIHKFDIVVGWLLNGIMSSFLKKVLHLNKVKVCLILYHIPNYDSSVVCKFKHYIMHKAYGGVNLLLALDVLQASSFRNALIGKVKNIQALRYGVDSNWYKPYLLNYIHKKNIQNTIFCPGSAHRDDETLKKAAHNLPVEIKRYQLNKSIHEDMTVERKNKTNISTFYNKPYDEYISECLNSTIVVIAVNNSDKPVGLTSLLECMALGRPIIISDGASSRDYIQDGVNGILYKEGDWADLRKKILFLIDNPEISKKIGLLARRSVEDKYDLEGCGNKFYSQLLSMVEAKK
jgi:glycosyltransferase involved in cell wall biosynthesis